MLGEDGATMPGAPAAPAPGNADAGSARRPVRSNRDRTEATREALIAAARARFVSEGFAATSTPAIVADAGVTRGALYHHFEDKRDLFQAVVEREAEAVANRIGTVGVDRPLSPREVLFEGSRAYLEAMRVPGRTRLLLIEAPAVLGAVDARRVDDRHAGATLVDALARVLGWKRPAGDGDGDDRGDDRGRGDGHTGFRGGDDGGVEGEAATQAAPQAFAQLRGAALPLDATATLLSAAFDRAALAIDAGHDAGEITAAMLGLIEGVIVLASRR